MNSNRKIVVLTPVKNEAWILHRFLRVTSIFADAILIADQQSIDGSLEIYPHYPKVTLINNENTNFNEAERQLLLLNKARELYGTNTILLAIDADEILAANAMQTENWENMVNGKPGTVLYFEKPSFYKNTSKVIRFNGGGWPLGYIDDGAEHEPSEIHSVRIPNPENASTLYLNEIKFLHYNTTRLSAFKSKLRFYSILENIKNSRNLRRRLRMYNSEIDILEIGDYIESTPKEWLKKWEENGIEMHLTPEEDYYWYDYEALKLLLHYGPRRFLLDDIWNFDWETFRQTTSQPELGDFSKEEIKRPFFPFSKLLQMSIKSLDRTWQLTKRFNKFSFKTNH
ncbi:glycosyltransferase family 2 protein [Salegentibacter sp. F188]|uniref:Glycosyltransferase family 2 protein n=1 Tax=Autumnicola patrickiae TaxID=3075591 RepID=A0ABU3DYQ2_9FLAO|nr:glycosyltransferase family 2 protein [Salegentibacter sp. F188]MDT0688836.1 glycosyltransferase family 2 protein [Salegentibacter sp. F188]